jgi:hypothetical protein
MLAAAKLLVELKHGKGDGQFGPEQAAAELAGLDDWVLEHYGSAGYTWPEYWEYRASLEQIKRD